MCQRSWPPLLTNMTSLKSVPIQFCRCETLIEGKIYKEDGNPEVASSQDWPPLQNTIQFWEEHYFITTRKLYIQTPSIHCYFGESISCYIPNDKGLYRKIQQWRKAKLMLCHFKLFTASREICRVLRCKTTRHNIWYYQYQLWGGFRTTDQKFIFVCKWYDDLQTQIRISA